MHSSASSWAADEQCEKSSHSPALVAPDKRSATPDDAVFGTLHFYTCALGECLYTGLFGALDHSDPSLISG